LRPGYSTAPDWVRNLGFGAGMGLNNIQKCADKMELTSTQEKGTRLKIYINLEKGGKFETN
jgi:anti-sigma regulatory factor (Ser/Thr protein kinase)